MARGDVLLVTLPLRGLRASVMLLFQHGDTEITEPTQRNPISRKGCISGRQLAINP